MRRRTYWLLGLTLVLVQFVSCQRRLPFNPALAGRFFPLGSGLTWTYQVTFSNGARETITEHSVELDPGDNLPGAALVVSNYSGIDGNRAARPNLPESYPGKLIGQLTDVETHYMLNGDYITRITSLGRVSRILTEERDFLPHYLKPDLVWSSTQLDVLKVIQTHRSFLEADEVITPAGRFSGCIRIETEASYHSPAGIGAEAGVRGRRYFTDWYAPDVGLVMTLVSTDGQDGRPLARIELLRFAKSAMPLGSSRPDGRPIVPLSSKIAHQPR